MFFIGSDWMKGVPFDTGLNCANDASGGSQDTRLRGSIFIAGLERFRLHSVPEGIHSLPRLVGESPSNDLVTGPHNNPVQPNMTKVCQWFFIAGVVSRLGPLQVGALCSLVQSPNTSEYQHSCFSMTVSA
ncbi:MAG: hypothetical protein CMJ75_06755 [Planctomycetaceae bacterium]|nr:hypothetical protein [Planctomycetaceae bacterium]